MTIRHRTKTEPQKRFWKSDARFRLFMGGRGSGKTRAGAIEVFRQPSGSTSLIIAPNYPQLRLGALRTVLDLAVRAGIDASWNKQEFELRLINGSVVIFRSADTPDRIRGANVSFLWLDEARDMHDSIWRTSLGALRVLPMRGIVTTTPNGRDWVQKLFGRGGDYETVQSSSADNPFLPDGFVDLLRATMTSEMARQEIEGDIVDLSGGMFQRGWLRYVAEYPAGLQWHRYWDLASSTRQAADYTASVRVALHDGIMYIADGIRLKAEWPDTRRVMVETMLREANTSHGIEKAQHGLAAVQELRRMPELANVAFRGIDVKGDKLQRAMPWAARAESDGVRVVAGDWSRDFLDEVVAFPRGAHDDYVDAVSGAVGMMSVRPLTWSIT